MEERPRDPKSSLLDPASLRFIVATGVAKAAAGGALLVVMPGYGYGLHATRSSLFLYESIARLVFAYPSRRVGSAPAFNIALHLSVVLGTALQLLTVTVPGPRTLLGLEYPGLSGLGWVAAAVMLSWGVAETFTRVSRRRGAVL